MLGIAVATEYPPLFSFRLGGFACDKTKLAFLNIPVWHAVGDSEKLKAVSYLPVVHLHSVEQGLDEGASVTIGFCREAEVQIDLEETLLVESVRGVERRVVVASEQVQGDTSHRGGDVFRWNVIDRMGRKPTFRHGEWQYDIGDDGGSPCRAHQGVILFVVRQGREGESVTEELPVAPLDNRVQRKRLPPFPLFVPEEIDCLQQGGGSCEKAGTCREPPHGSILRTEIAGAPLDFIGNRFATF